MNKNSKIYIAGHRGLVGSAILRLLEKEGYKNIIYKTHSELNLTDKTSTLNFFEKRSLNMCFWQLQRSGEFTQTILIRPNS